MTDQPNAGQRSSPLPSSSLAVQLRQAEAGIRDRLLPVLTEHGLTAEHWRIIAVVDDHPGVTMSTVATSAVVPAATLTRHVDKLVERALLVRRADPDDKRRVVLALSPAGQSYARRLRAAEQSAPVPATATVLVS